jgi:hypothetical protein
VKHQYFSLWNIGISFYETLVFHFMKHWYFILWNIGISVCETSVFQFVKHQYFSLWNISISVCETSVFQFVKHWYFSLWNVGISVCETFIFQVVKHVHGMHISLKEDVNLVLLILHCWGKHTFFNLTLSDPFLLKFYVNNKDRLFETWCFVRRLIIKITCLNYLVHLIKRWFL